VNNKFKVGDRVMIVNYSPKRNLKIGTVRHLSEFSDGVGVEHDEEIENGHYLDNHCQDKYGWYYGENQIKLLEPTRIDDWESEFK